MLKSDLHPPRNGPNADPVLYGVAAGLAELFPPVTGRAPSQADPQERSERDADREPGEPD